MQSRLHFHCVTQMRTSLKKAPPASRIQSRKDQAAPSAVCLHLLQHKRVSGLLPFSDDFAYICPLPLGLPTEQTTFSFPGCR